MKPSNIHFFPAKFDDRPPTTKQTLRRLFLALFLRGQTGMNPNKEQVPGSMAAKVWMSMLLPLGCGMMAFFLMQSPVFVLSVYLHSMTFALIGMMLASTTGGVLFNKEEADILSHRPIEAKDLLWAKMSVLLEYSLWTSMAFNLPGLILGGTMPDGGWRFFVAHVLSVVMESVFCASCVVIVYQLCLRWCGRERLESVITWTQVGMTVLIVVGSQVFPRFMMQGKPDELIRSYSKWIAFVPPAWFAEFDRVATGQFHWQSIMMACLAAVMTMLLAWIAFDKLAKDFEAGIQRLSEQTGRAASSVPGRRWIDRIADSYLLKWWLHDPVERAAFVLTSVYLTRDRDAKLRIYPSVLPMMVMPIVMMFQDRAAGGHANGIGVAFVGGFLSMLPVMGIAQLKFSQQWQASEIFHTAPLSGPGALCHGARKAILCFMQVPFALLLLIFCVAFRGSISTIALMIPGLMLTPFNSLLPCLQEKTVPFSEPVLQGKAHPEFTLMFGTIMFSMFVSFLGFGAWALGFFIWFLLIETIVVVSATLALSRQVTHRKWGDV